MHSCLYEGQVIHQRHEPIFHRFRYALFLMYLDLGELDTVFRNRWLWSTKRPSIAWFRRKDYLGDSSKPLEQCVRNLVENETGVRPNGPIRLLTHLRYFGYVMNPVSFYYCFDDSDQHVEAVVAEVNNTPWNERHCYVLQTPMDRHIVTQKEFHVSPFMGMDMEYRWRLSLPGEHLTVRMENHQQKRAIFDASLSLKRGALTRWNLARALLRFPFMTARVTAGIYWQALRLKLKGVPFHSHPKHHERKEKEVATR
ncbi:MAG: DUF1365 domain-containing protein [Planctomycetaceae bacterium]